jgi:hypothetical protein
MLFYLLFLYIIIPIRIVFDLEEKKGGKQDTNSVRPETICTLKKKLI